MCVSTRESSVSAFVGCVSDSGIYLWIPKHLMTFVVPCQVCNNVSVGFNRSTCQSPYLLMISIDSSFIEALNGYFNLCSR